MKTTDTSERGLETIIESYLVDHNGYQQSYSIDYDRDLCINKKLLMEFIQETQPDAYATISNRGADKFIKRLSEQIKKHGSYAKQTILRQFYFMTYFRQNA